MSATASAGVIEGYLSHQTNLFNLDRHVNSVRVLWHDYDRGAPLSRLGHWSYDSLAG